MVKRVNGERSTCVKDVVHKMKRCVIIVSSQVLWGGSSSKKVSFKSGKRGRTEELRQSSVNSSIKPQYCVYCQNSNVNILKSCGKCGVVKYCSKLCQRSHWESHQKICDAIVNLSNQKKRKIEKMGQYQAHLTPKEKSTLIGLVGKKNIVKLYMNDECVDVLWDSGANICIINKEFVNNFFPNIVIKDLCDILSDADKLQVKWGNNNVLPYEGYVELEVSLKKGDMTNTILVPFLVTTETIQNPILGYKCN